MHAPRRRLLQSLASGFVGSAVAGCLDRTGQASSAGTQTASGDGLTPADSPSPTETSPETATDRLDETPGDGLRWAFDVGEFAAGPRFSNGLVFVASQDGVVRGLDTDGTVRWRFDAPKPIGGEGPGIEFDLYRDLLVVVSGENRGTEGVGYTAHALDAATGEERWTHGIGGGFGGLLGDVAGGLALANGDDVVGPSGNRTYLLEFDGTARWSADTGDALAAAGGGGRVYVGSYGVIRGFDAATGEKAWRVDATPNYLGMVADETTLYSVEDRNDDGPYERLAARDGETGDLYWETDWQVSSLQRDGADGVVAGGNRLVSYAPDGDVRWEYGPGGSASGPIDEGVLYTSSGRAVIALSLADGTERWRTTGEAASARLAAHGEGVVVSRDYDAGRYFVHDATTGTVRWSLDAVGVVPSGVTVGDGTVFVTTKNGRLLAHDL